MKRFCLSVLSVIIVLAVVGNPAFAASNHSASAKTKVTASAVIVPAQVSEVGFLISGIVKEVPVKEGDPVKGGQTLMVLDTPNLQFGVEEAQANLRAVQAQADIRSNEIIKKYRIIYRRTTILLEKLR